MFEEESIWIKNKIADILIKDPKGINTVLDVGSSTLKFRTITQSCIDENIFKPLRNQQKEIHYLDIKEDEGIDIVCGIDNIGAIGRKFDLVICANLLEHVGDVKKTANNLKSLVKKGGYLLVTVPHFYFYHPDPIDTMYRPNSIALEELFGWQETYSEVIKLKKLYFSARLRCFGKMILSIPYGTDKYLPYLFGRFKVSCVLLKNNDSI